MKTFNRPSPNEKDLLFIESLPDEEVVKLLFFTDMQMVQLMERLALVKNQIYRRGIDVKKIKEII